MIIAVAMTELGDIAVDQPDLIPFHLGIAFRDRAFPEAQRFYFRARQHYASFVHIVDGIVIARAPVLSDGFHLVERGVTRSSRLFRSLQCPVRIAPGRRPDRTSTRL